MTRCTCALAGCRALSGATGCTREGVQQGTDIPQRDLIRNKQVQGFNVQVFNKVDVTRHDLPVRWMADFDAFQRALDSDDSYAGSLSRSLALVLDEFYSNLSTVGVSSVTGEGMPDLFAVRPSPRRGTRTLTPNPQPLTLSGDLYPSSTRATDRSTRAIDCSTRATDCSMGHSVPCAPRAHGKANTGAKRCSGCK